ncbi:MAG: hypothetical protein P8177_12340, partial [Gemmatimonadota bacterium]
TLVYVGPASTGQQLWVKERGSERGRPLSGTASAQHPEVDPTGEWVAYTADGALRKMALTGGPSIVLADSVQDAAGSVAWLDDGTIAYTGLGWIIRRVPEQGGASEELYQAEDGDNIVLGLSPLPDGKLLFVLCQGLCQSASDLWVMDLATREPRMLVPGVTGAWFVRSGHLVLARPDGSVFGVEFDPGTLELGGEPIPLFDGIQVDQGVIPDMEVGLGGQALVRLGGEGMQDRSFFWSDRAGARTPVDPDFTYRSQTFVSWRLSPDGRHVAFERTTDEGTDIWVKELDTGPAYRLTFDPSLEFRPEWYPDGESILFVSQQGGNRDLYRRRANATGPVELVIDRTKEISQGVWSPDGQLLVYREGTAEGRDIWGFRPGQDSVPRPLIADPGYDEKAPAISPDGRWIAYESRETGRDEVYVRPFPEVEDNRWQVSVGGGRQPVWSPDGRELYYVRGDDELVAAGIDAGPPFNVTRREALFPAGDVAGTGEDHAVYDIHPDGDRVLFSVPATGDPESEAYWLMIDDWTTELSARLGDGR